MIDLIDKDEVRKKSKTIPSNRICSKCGKGETYVAKNGYEEWGKFYDENGKLVKGQYLCRKCRGLSYDDKTRKPTTAVRIGNLNIDSNLAKALISQAVVAKVLHIEDLNIKHDNYEWLIDLEHVDYGRIDVKSSSLQDYGRWYWYPVRKNPRPGRNKKQIVCKTYICVGYDYKRKNIDVVLIIPSEKCNVSTINYNKNSRRGNKYEKYIVGSAHYNDAYHCLMQYLKNKRFFGVEDIEEWMTL